VDADAKHQMSYSPFHSDANLCGTCHDVSNPAFGKEPGGAYLPNSFDQPAPDFDPRSMFPVERTFSEWLMSAYNTPEGVYAPQFGGNKDTVSTCQDCHMKDVTGAGCNKQGVPVREDLPLHDQTGGNTFFPGLIDAVFPGEADTAALFAGVVRATYMLQNAATMSLAVTAEQPGYSAQVTVTNQTGHKLPSGYPEGRRIWINLRAYDNTDALIYESGAYDPETGILTHDADVKTYEIKPGISQALAPIVNLPAGPSFHFVLNDTIYKDNRIPPRGFTNAAFDSIQSPPVDYSYADGEYWDLTEYSIPDSTAQVVATLYYQSTSKEYVEFLRDENVTNDWGTTLYDLWSTNGKSPPVAMVADTFIIEQANRPPTLDSIGAQTVNEGEVLELRIWAVDPDGDSIILNTDSIPTNAEFEDSGSGAGLFTFSPDHDQAGTYHVVFIASDGLLADSELVQTTVLDVNRPPVLDSIGPQQVYEGDTLEVRISSSDPDGDSIFLSADGLPANAAFEDSGNGTGALVFTPDSTQAGSYEITLVASDGDLADSQAIDITVIDSAVFLCGDANADGAVNVGDVVFLVSFLYRDGDPPAPMEAGDVNLDGVVNVGDVVYLTTYLYRDGPPPCEP